jgi:hypothetical protein
MCVANVFLYSFIRDHSTSYGGINKKKKYFPLLPFILLKFSMISSPPQELFKKKTQTVDHLDISAIMHIYCYYMPNLIYRQQQNDTVGKYKCILLNTPAI